MVFAVNLLAAVMYFFEIYSANGVKPIAYCPPEQRLVL